MLNNIYIPKDVWHQRDYILLELCIWSLAVRKARNISNILTQRHGPPNGIVRGASNMQTTLYELYYTNQLYMNQQYAIHKWRSEFEEPMSTLALMCF